MKTLLIALLLLGATSSYAGGSSCAMKDNGPLVRSNSGSSGSQGTVSQGGR